MLISLDHNPTHKGGLLSQKLKRYQFVIKISAEGGVDHVDAQMPFVLHGEQSIFGLCSNAAAEFVS